MEKISQLREICQGTRESQIYQFNWFDRHVLRRISIYITWACLRMGLSANQLTFVDLLCVVAAGVCFLFTSPVAWLVGYVFIYLYLQVDCVDGEIARYHGSKGKDNRPLGQGAVFGGVVDWFVWAYWFACMSFGIFVATGSEIVFAFGFGAVIFRYLYQDMGLMPYPILHEKGILAEAVSQVDGSPLTEPKMQAVGRAMFGIRGFLPAFLTVVLLDLFLPGMAFSARYAYLIIYALSSAGGVLLKLRNVYYNGAKIERI